MQAQQQPLFYGRVVVLNRERHRDLRLEPATDLGFAREANSVYLTTVEFARAARHYPIVFAGEGEGLSPVALLGLERHQNLFIGDSGRWDADYVPAYVRRYPFILARGEGGDKLTVCVDETYPGLGDRGERLFQEDGSESPFLDRSVAFLKDYQVQHERTRAFCQAVDELGVLDPMAANVTLPGGGKLTLQGFRVVSRERFKALSEDRVMPLLRNGVLELIYTHLFSLNNFQGLVDRLARRKQN
jgi:hypothetical protein